MKRPILGRFQDFFIIQAREMNIVNHLQMLCFIAFVVLSLYSLTSFVHVFQFL